MKSRSAAGRIVPIPATLSAREPPRVRLPVVLAGLQARRGPSSRNRPGDFVPTSIPSWPSGSASMSLVGIATVELSSPVATLRAASSGRTQPTHHRHRQRQVAEAKHAAPRQQIVRLTGRASLPVRPPVSGSTLVPSCVRCLVRSAGRPVAPVRETSVARYTPPVVPSGMIARSVSWVAAGSGRGVRRQIGFYDLPAANWPEYNKGLTLADAMSALAALVAHPGCAGLTVTEFNPDHGEPDGSTVRTLAAALATALSGRPS